MFLPRLWKKLKNERERNEEWPHGKKNRNNPIVILPEPCKNKLLFTPPSPLPFLLSAHLPSPSHSLQLSHLRIIVRRASTSPVPPSSPSPSLYFSFQFRTPPSVSPSSSTLLFNLESFLLLCFPLSYPHPTSPPHTLRSAFFPNENDIFLG